MTDLEIAHSSSLRPIKDIACKIGIENSLECHGNYMAKVIVDELKYEQEGKLVLVTATSPTPFGEGKTTVSIGLIDALNSLGISTVGSLREPSLGPVFGLKGGATGGGYAQVIPMEDINLHFTGDFHAITAANNLLCAAIDNHLEQGNALNLDVTRIMFSRCLDVNDRALRSIHVVGKDYERDEHFTITAASEIMAILCLAKDLKDLKKRLDNILIGYNVQGTPVFAKELKITGSLLVLLKDAIKPNLVQTLEGNPVFVHGGPFANIAHGCSSYIATHSAMQLSGICVTEAGFGSDLGALKFFDIKGRIHGLHPNVTVLVTTIKALKYNGHNDLHSGIRNLEAHLDILQHMTKNIIVCLNRYSQDKEEDIAYVRDYVVSRNFLFSISDSYASGGKGCVDLAKLILSIDNEEENVLLYDENDSIKDKISSIVKDVYHAGEIVYQDLAENKIKELEANGLDKLPICIAKTPTSISDKKELLGNPSNYEVTIRDVKLYNGAGFITIYLGNIITMPGLPERPNYEKIDLIDNEIVGLF